ncbi:MAG: hypothetical protein ACRCSK_04105 [Fusobacteriaceae bacterium]
MFVIKNRKLDRPYYLVLVLIIAIIVWRTGDIVFKIFAPIYLIVNILIFLNQFFYREIIEIENDKLKVIIKNNKKIQEFEFFLNEVQSIKKKDTVDNMIKIFPKKYNKIELISNNKKFEFGILNGVQLLNFFSELKKQKFDGILIENIENIQKKTIFSRKKIMIINFIQMTLFILLIKAIGEGIIIKLLFVTPFVISFGIFLPVYLFKEYRESFIIKTILSIFAFGILFLPFLAVDLTGYNFVETSVFILLYFGLVQLYLLGYEKTLIKFCKK